MSPESLFAFAKILVKFCGLFRSEETNKFPILKIQTWIYAAASTLLQISIWLDLFLEKNLVKKMQVMYLATGCGHTYYKHLNFFFKTKDLYRLFDCLEHLFIDSTKDQANRAIMTSVTNRANKINKYFASALFGVFLTSVVTTFYSYFTTESPESLELPLAFWTPFDVKTDFWMASAYQLIILPGFMSFITCFVILTSITMQLSGQIQILKISLSSISATSTGEDLKKCIRLHNSILKLIKATNDLLSSMLAVELILSTLQSCFAIHYIVKYSEDLQATIFNSSSVLAVLTSPIIICWSGYEIERQYEGVLNSAFNSAWYELPRTLKKDFYFIMLVASRPKTYNYKNVIVINMEQYTMVLQRAYSYYAVLQTMET